MDNPNSFAITLTTTANFTRFFMPSIANNTPQEESAPTAEDAALLEQLFSEHNLSEKYKERCSSLNYFNNKAIGGIPKFEQHDDKIDHSDYPQFKRYALHELSTVLAQKKHTAFRFVVLKNDAGAEIVFSQGLGGSDAMSHGQLACKQETYCLCIAAGEIEFVHENGQWLIKSLSNKSGHFKGGVETLIAPLILLLENTTYPFAAKLCISQYINDLINDVEITASDLKKKYEQCVTEKVPVIDENTLVQFLPRRELTPPVVDCQTEETAMILTTTAKVTHSLHSHSIFNVNSKPTEQDAQNEVPLRDSRQEQNTP